MSWNKRASFVRKWDTPQIMQQFHVNNSFNQCSSQANTKTAYGLQHRHSPSYRSFFLSTADICCCLSPSFRRNIVSPALNLIGKATTIYKLLLFLYFYHFSSCLQMWFLARSRWLEFGSFLILSCWTECRRDAALTHCRPSRRKVVLRDSTGHG